MAINTLTPSERFGLMLRAMVGDDDPWAGDWWCAHAPEPEPPYPEPPDDWQEHDEELAEAYTDYADPLN